MNDEDDDESDLTCKRKFFGAAVAADCIPPTDERKEEAKNTLG